MKHGCAISEFVSTANRLKDHMRKAEGQQKLQTGGPTGPGARLIPCQQACQQRTSAEVVRQEPLFTPWEASYGSSFLELKPTSKDL